jgi:hypothetical protein
VRKRQWFFLGVLGTLIGMAVRLVRGRRGEPSGPTRWDTPSNS